MTDMEAVRHLAIACAILALTTASAAAATFDVTRFDDPPGQPTTGLSLRQAVLAANAAPGADTITLHAGTYRLTIRGDDTTAEAGDLDITDIVTIEGDPSGRTVIDAKRCRDRAFEVLAGGDLTVRHVTIKGGNAVSSGGAIFSVGALTVQNATFTGNRTGDQGAGIACYAGTCTLTDCVFKGGRALNDAGACAFEFATTATLLRVTMSGNFAADTGGGVDTDDGATVSITDSTVSGNKSRNEGGGLDPSIGTLTLTNVTVSGNRSLKGGGIQLESGGFLNLDHVTIAHNRAKEGAGLWTEAGTTATLTATILATNAPFDCFGPIVSNGSNLIGRSDGCVISGDTTGNIVGGSGRRAKPINPRLGPLAANGGTTKTHALLRGSPAIDAVVGTCAPAADQRGSPRVGACDIGAFEAQ
jgi:hypothetical protein